MNFEELIKRLSNGETMEQITKGSNVECVGNEVYEDNDLHEFLNSIGAEIEEFGTGFAVLNTDNNKIYELPYTNRVNRFGYDLPEETILFFDCKRIYDVTENRN